MAGVPRRDRDSRCRAVQLRLGSCVVLGAQRVLEITNSGPAVAIGKEASTSVTAALRWLLASTERAIRLLARRELLGTASDKDVAFRGGRSARPCPPANSPTGTLGTPW